MKGSAWPLLVGEVICLLNCDNERDLCQLLDAVFVVGQGWIRGSLRVHISLAEKTECLLIGIMKIPKFIETRAQSRSVMLLNVLGCTRTTLTQTTSFDSRVLPGNPWPEEVGKSCQPES
jgi:hypothetical protein